MFLISIVTVLFELFSVVILIKLTKKSNFRIQILHLSCSFFYTDLENAGASKSLIKSENYLELYLKASTKFESAFFQKTYGEFQLPVI